MGPITRFRRLALAALTLGLTLGATTLPSPSPVSASGTIATSGGAVQITGMTGQTGCSVDVSGTWTGTLHVQGSTNWSNLAFSTYGSSSTVSSVTGNGLFFVQTPALSQIRVTGPTSTGTASIQMLCTIGTVTGFAAPPAPAAQPFQFVYESCGPTYGTSPGCGGTGISPNARQDDMASLGFNGVINYSIASSTAAQFQDYINHGVGVGLKDIVAVKGLHGDAAAWSAYAADSFDNPLPATCTNPITHVACASFDDLVKYMASLANPLPGTWGYYVADEPTLNDTCSTADVPIIQQLINDIRAVDTTHPIMIALAWWQITGQASMTAQVGCWTDTAAKLDVGFDYYLADNGGAYQGWLANAVTANAAKGVAGGVFVSWAFSFANYDIFNSGANSLLTTTSAPITAGATTVSVASAAGIAIGSNIMVKDQNGGTQLATPPYGVADISEDVHVTNVSGTTVTVSPAFGASHLSGLQVYVGNNTCSPSSVWSCQPFPSLALMQSQKTNTIAASIPNLQYGFFSYYDVAQREFPNDPVSIVTKRQRLCTAVGTEASC